MARRLNLYVWEDVLEDWSAGAIFVLAGSPEEARVMARDGWTEGSLVWSDTEAEPRCVTERERFIIWGGG